MGVAIRIIFRCNISGKWSNVDPYFCGLTIKFWLVTGDGRSTAMAERGTILLPKKQQEAVRISERERERERERIKINYVIR